MNRFVVRKELNRVSFRFNYRVHDTLHDEPVGKLYAKLRAATRRCDHCNAIAAIEAHRYMKAKDNG